MKIIKQYGFTLLELLIAMFVFAIFATLAAKGFHLILNNVKQTQALSLQMRPLQESLVILEHDLQQAIDRPIWNEHNKLIPSFIAQNNNLEFTHLGAHFANKNHHSELERVCYIWDGKKQQLLRYHWEVLDRVDTTQPNVEIVLSNITAIKFKFFSKQKTFDQWPIKQNNSPPLPQAVEIEFTLKNQGSLQHWFIIGGNKFG